MTLSLASRLARTAVAAAALTVLAAPAISQDDDSIRYTTDTTQTSLPIWYAQENGLFRKHGLQYSDTLVNAGFLGLQSIGAGRNDASIQSDPPTCANIAKGIDAKVIAVIAKGDESMALVAGKDVSSIEDLKGKKVIWMTGTGGELGFFKFLDARGMKPDDFEHINLPPAEAVPTLVNGGADAMWFWEPWPRKAVDLASDSLHIVSRSSRDEYDLNMMLTVGREFAETHPETVQKFLQVLIEATDALRADPEAAAELYQRRLRTSAEDAHTALGDYPLDVYLSKDFVDELTDICQLKVDLGHIDKAPDWNQVVDPSYLKAVAPDRVKGL